MASLDESINIIRETPISSIISLYHPIKRKGANFEGICPFHGDTHPSLIVNDQKGIFKCFACGVGGDSFKFVMNLQNLEFVDAVKEIASKVGLQIDEQKPKYHNPKMEMSLRVLKAAQKIFKKTATQLRPAHFENFLKNRKLNSDSVKNFELGFAPGNNALTHYLHSLPNEKEREFALQCALELGIIRPNKHGEGHYDFYRDRVMFPIWDHQGQVRGFSSRAVLENQKPKYLNSGESFIFDKKNILYGFNIAKKSIRQLDAVLIVEGNMDVVALHQYGFNYSVGTMGVAISPNSVQLLSNMAKTVYLGLDSDPAGLKATERINALFMQQGILPKFVDYSPAKDPDDFLKDFGRLELAQRLEKSPSALDFFIQQKLPNPIPQTTDKKLAALNELFEVIAPLKEHLMAIEKVIEVAKALGLRSAHEDIVSAYKDYLKSNGAPTYSSRLPQTGAQSESAEAPEADQTPPHRQNNNIDDQVLDLDAGSGSLNQELTKSEKLLLEQVLSHPECVQDEQILEILDLIDHFEVKTMIRWLKKIYLEIDESDYEHVLKKKMASGVSRQIGDCIAGALFRYNKVKLVPKVVDKLLKDFIAKAKVEKLRLKKQELTRLQRESLTEEESFKYLNDILQVEKQLREIRYKPL